MRICGVGSEEIRTVRFIAESTTGARVPGMMISQTFSAFLNCSFAGEYQ
jgi:hypothetical protein